MNKWDENGLPQGYWVDSIGDSLYCGFYEYGKAIGVWRTYEDGVLYNIHTRGIEPYWNIYYHREIFEYLGGTTEYIHIHHNE